MKLSFKQIEPFINNPDPKARIILVYGPDQGLVQERSKIISQKSIDDINDPFNVITLSAEKLIDDQAAFFDEAYAQSLMGGARLITIKNAGDSLNPLIKDYLSDPSNETLVIIESDNLGPRSSLRQICEKADNAAALPCYVDDERNLANIIRDMCMHAGYGIDQNALMAFSSAIVGDRSIARSEIEKLLLYKGLESGYSGFDGDAVRERKGQITMDDINASCGDVRDWSIDRLIYAVGGGNIKETHISLQSLIKDQMPVITLLRSIQNYFWRLLSVQAKIKDGFSQQEALKTLNPPLFFKVEDAFKQQLNRWSITALQKALERLNHVEAQSKKTEYSDISILQNTLVQLAQYIAQRN